MKTNLLYYVTPLAWGMCLLWRWGIFYLYPDDLAMQKQAGFCVVLLLIPYVLYIISAIHHIRNFRKERNLLLLSTAYILLYYFLVGV